MQYWVWLGLLKGIGPVIQKRLLGYFEDAESVFRASKSELMKVSGVGNTLSETIKSTSLEGAKRTLEKADKLNIKILTYNDHLYNIKAKQCPYSPVILYYRGNLLPDSTGVGIVGARRCTDYGKEVVKEAAGYLANKKIPVISGMARGIDGYAHTACLKAGGYTLAFFGNGVDICYPKEHSELMENIIENGAVLSQFPPGTRPKPEYFPRRNSLMSAWCEKLLVVEAGKNSGSLITAQYMREVEREVLAVPNQIYNQTGKGTNFLILKGAGIYLCPEQLLPDNEKEFPIMGKNIDSDEGKISKIHNETKTPGRQLSEKEKKIIESISINPKTIEELSQLTEINQIELLEQLSVLELEGIIEASAGGKFRAK
ncbi:MAG TPA: DNA-processing protein DprA [Clostridia bacterium]|nr:DNA-processing protein DprA [Clostridia bacterium]